MENKNTFDETFQMVGDINLIFLHTNPKSYHLHWHKQAEMMYYPMKAKSDHNPLVKINDTIYEMKPGDILIAWPGELHETIDNSENQIIGIQFSTALLNEMRDFAPYLHLFRAYHHLKEEKHPDLAPALASHIEAINEIYTDGQPFSNTRMLISLYELFMDACLYMHEKYADNPEHNSLENNKTFTRISQACQYIQDNCDQLLTLQTVADYIGFSTYYFSRVFKSLTGTSFLEYLTMQRIKKAQSLLADSTLSVTDIAYQSGYTSISTFNRVFRKSRGCSPTEYRKYYI